MNLFAGRGRTLMTAATAAAVVAAGGLGAGCGKSTPSAYSTIIETVNGYTFKMLPVEGGKFKMGCTSERRYYCDDDEKPKHSVTLSSYYIGKYEVTQGLWKAVMGSLPPYLRSSSEYGYGDDYPVYYVSWNDIVNDFIPKLNELTGKTYRLPTEAEWEYAARGGNKSYGYIFSGSNEINDVAWHYYNGKGTGGSTTNPVGKKSRNELGICDMSGNVSEWVSDWYKAYSSTAQTNPKGPDAGSYRVLRGGRCCDGGQSCRVSNRSFSIPDERNSYRGFRLALSSP